MHLSKSQRLAERATLVAALALVNVTLPAYSQAAYPSKPVRLVVGFSAGGPTDVVARAFADFATRTLGQPFIVDNKPGANTILAADAVAGAAPDGYTLLVGATNHTMIPALYSARVKFDAVRSFAPICTVAISPTILVVGPALKAPTLAAFLQQVKAQPGRITYGTPGAGSSGHFASEQFTRLTGTSMNHIPYKGAAQAVTDLMGGQLDSSFATLGSVLPQVQSGRLTALAVAASQRSALLPNVPTFDEAGVAGYRADAWYGLLAPANTPAAIRLRQLSRAWKKQRGPSFRRQERSTSCAALAWTPKATAGRPLAHSCSAKCRAIPSSPANLTSKLSNAVEKSQTLNETPRHTWLPSNSLSPVALHCSPSRP